MTKAPEMSKRHYEFIAQIIAQIDSPDRAAIARRFGAEFLDSNPRFDLARFLAACKES